MNYKISEKGRSMVEMMGYLMVMMSVIIAIGKIVSSAFNNHRYSTATVQLTDLATSMVKAAALDVDYTFVLKDILGASGNEPSDCLSGGHYVIKSDGDTMKIIPPSFRKAGNKLYHVFGGEVGICKSTFKECAGVANSNGQCPGDLKARVDQFSITYAGLNKKQCVELAMKNWQKNQYVDLYAIIINGKNNWFWTAYGDENGTAVKLDEGKCDTAGTTCAFPIKRAKLSGVGKNDGQCKENNNTVTWVFN